MKSPELLALWMMPLESVGCLPLGFSHSHPPRVSGFLCSGTLHMVAPPPPPPPSTLLGIITSFQNSLHPPPRPRKSQLSTLNFLFHCVCHS